MDGSADRFLDLMHHLRISPPAPPSRGGRPSVFDETTLQLFWIRGPQLSEWAGSRGYCCQKELAGPSSSALRSELFEIVESGLRYRRLAHGRLT